jgi:hypothetical protein
LKITRPTDEFWEATKAATFHRPDTTSDRILSATASSWRTEENHFAAGWATGRAMSGAWGEPDKMYDYFNAAVQDYQKCINSHPPESYPGLAALLQISSLLGQASWMFGLDKNRLRIQREGVLEELGQRLISYYVNSPNKAGYLVTGINLKTDLVSVDGQRKWDWSEG